MIAFVRSCVVALAFLVVTSPAAAQWTPVLTLSFVFVNRLAMSGTELYAGRLDGLWHRSTVTAVQPASWGALKSRFR